MISTDCTNAAWTAIVELAGVVGGIRGHASGLRTGGSQLAPHNQRAAHLDELANKLEAAMHLLKAEVNFPDWPEPTNGATT